MARLRDLDPQVSSNSLEFMRALDAGVIDYEALIETLHPKQIENLVAAGAVTIAGNGRVVISPLGQAVVLLHSDEA
jgi:hypothetical protein